MSCLLLACLWISVHLLLNTEPQQLTAVDHEHVDGSEREDRRQEHA